MLRHRLMQKSVCLEGRIKIQLRNYNDDAFRLNSSVLFLK